MMQTTHTNIAVVGSGLSGTLTALALSEFSPLVIAKGYGATALGSGAFDLLASRRADLPFAGRLAAFVAGQPRHPLAVLGAVEADFAEAEKSLRAALAPSLDLDGSYDITRPVLTNLGTAKATNLVASSHALADTTKLRGKRVVVVEIDGFADFFPEAIVRFLAGAKITDRAEARRIALPAFADRANIPPFELAASLDDGTRLREFAEAVRRAAAGAEMVILPPVVGLKDARTTFREFADLVGLPIAETLSTHPSVPGTRLARALDRALAEAGVAVLKGEAVGSKTAGKMISEIVVRSRHGEHAEANVMPKAVVFAGGTYIAGGLARHEKNIVEPLFGLPLRYRGKPVTTVQWDEMVAPTAAERQPLMEIGIATGGSSNPLDGSGGEIANLFAVGNMIEGVDYTRGICASGLPLIQSLVAARAIRTFLG